MHKGFGQTQSASEQGKRVVSTMKAVTRNRAMSMEVKKAVNDSVVIPTLMYGSEARTVSESNEEVCEQ